VKPECSKDPDKKGGYDRERPIENRVSLSVMARCMSNPLDKVAVGSRVTFPTGFEEALL